MLNYNTTAVVTNDDLSCKAVIDLIDNTVDDFFYSPQELIGYCNFINVDKCNEFVSHICEIKDDIIHLYDCYNSL